MMPIRTVVVVCMAAALAAACGGGGSGSSGASGGTSGATPAVIGTLSLLAGDPYGPGSLDGTGAAASFSLPQSAATDGAGNVYVADTSNNTIRKVTSAGVVTTFAGTAGVIGHADGTGAAASFYHPEGVATDSAGNVYVADADNGTIRKITPAGVVTTLAGTAGVIGRTDGTGAAASFYHPEGVATDSAGNVYVADTFNNTIRRISPAGGVATLAGTAGVFGHADGTGAAASFWYPEGLATDGAGNVYVADTFNDTIREVTPAGVVTTLAGTAGLAGHADGTGAAASFNAPHGVATDGAGNVYVGDSGNGTIREITPAAVVTTLAGTAGVVGAADGTGAAASFSAPYGVAADNAGNLYVADNGNSTIREITPADAVTTLAGTAGVTGHADGTGAAASFNYPYGVATDSLGNLYVADASNDTIREITPAGVVTTLAGTAGVTGHADGTGAAASFYYPEGIAADGAGNVYVADTANSTIRKISPVGAVTTLAGTAGVIGHADGTGAAASFWYPEGLATDSSGNVYVADTANNIIRKITPAGVVTTLAGAPGVIGHGDGTGAAVSFNSPWSVATDSAGDVYVADRANDTIRKITPAGVVTTLAGTAGVMGHADGTGAAARFDHPEGVATDGAGDVYVADSGNSTIRRITPTGVVTTVLGQADVSGFAPGSPGVLDRPRRVALYGGILYATSNNAIVQATHVGAALH